MTLYFVHSLYPLFQLKNEEGQFHYLMEMSSKNKIEWIRLFLLFDTALLI